MAFKKIQHTNTCPETPEALYRDFKNRKIKGLLSQQADILRAYSSEGLDKTDLAFQLPTGSGKTLVGLLIAEWRRRKNGEKVVYICPTKQLANQVVEQSIEKYGIKCNAFVGQQTNYSPNIKSEYRNAETLAVTTYSGLFNTNSFFNDAKILIFDDVHSAENYIAKYWSLLVSRQQHKSLFQNLLTLLKPFLSTEDGTRMLSENPDRSDLQWVQKIPTTTLLELHSDLIQLLDEYRKDSNNSNEREFDPNIKYTWTTIRDHLLACHLYFSYNQILIRPLIPPTWTHPPFKNAKQRIYMSATMGEGGDLERLIGVTRIHRLPIPEGWNQQSIGRRLFFFPERTLNNSEISKFTNEIIKQTPRTLVLTPDKSQADSFKKLIEQEKYKIFDAQQLEKSKQEFITTDKAVAILANRYDGIDLAGDECRLLIIKDLQRATNLQEKFLVTRLAAGILLKDRILTRVVQALGRCIRSDTDYAAVVILGDDLSKLLAPETRKFLHPELQAEIEFGNQQSKDIQVKDFIENLNIFVKHGEDWNDADENIVEIRNTLQQEKLPGIDKLKDAVANEVEYQYALWNKNYEQAVTKCQSVLTSLSGDDVKGYRAFWNYLAGSSSWLGAKNGLTSMENQARSSFKKASIIAPEVSWFVKLSKLSLEDDQISQESQMLNYLIENLEIQLTNFGTANDGKFETEVKHIIDNINENISSNADNQQREKLAKAFEEAHVKLGRLLGYKADNPKGDSDPDPWWIIGDSLCFVFEDYSSGNRESSIGSNKVRQAASHPNWIKDKNLISTLENIIPVLITPCQTIKNDAIPHTQNVCYWNLQNFREWMLKAITGIRELRSSFSGEADIEWRKQAIQVYKDNEIDPDSLVKYLQSNPLKNLPNQ